MREQHDLVLILARGLASSIATPIFLVDPGGTLIYYNEPAEEVLGRRYAEAGSLTFEEWTTMFSVQGPSGEPMDPERLPLAIALSERRPAHDDMRITGLDGAQRDIQVTGVPLFARTDEFIGALAIFWET